MPKTFSQLPAITSTNSADLIPFWDTSTQKASHISVANLIADMNDGSGFAAHAANTGIHAPIDDGSTAATVLWSASKINTTINTHANTASVHRTINDGSTAATVLWSGNKINATIGTVSSGLTSHTGDAAIHRTIGDSTTSATRLWSASKINSEVSSVSSGLSSHTGDATIHRTINDSTTSATNQLWSAAKIHTTIAASGDFKKDGSVPMTGTLHLGGQAISSTSTDTLHTFGRAAIGFPSGAGNWAGFGHRDHMSNTNIALYQHSSGFVRINSPVGKSIEFRKNNVAAFVVNDADIELATHDLNIGTNVIKSSSTDTLHTLGRAGIGFSPGPASGNVATFGHRDHMTANTVAIRVFANGGSIYGAPTGGNFQYRINNVVKAILFDDRLDLKVKIDLNSNVIESNDAATLHTLGRAAIGYDGTHADDAVFAHRDYANGTDAGLRQDSFGSVKINAKTGALLRFTKNDVVALNINDTDIELATHDLNIGTNVIKSSSSATLHTLGRAAIGHDGTHTNDAVFAHRDYANGTDYGFLQNSAGNTFVNAKTGGSISFAINGVNQASVSDGFLFSPTDGATSLGASGFRWDNIWAVNGTIQTSDRNNKKYIKTLKKDRGLAFIEELRPVSFTFKKRVRTHYGLIAQEVKEVIGENDFAGYIYDKSEDGKETHGLRYTEFIAPMIKAIQELSAEVTALKAA